MGKYKKIHSRAYYTSFDRAHFAEHEYEGLIILGNYLKKILKIKKHREINIFISSNSFSSGI